MSECLIVLDAGTGSGRALVFASDGSQLGVGQEEWTHLSESDAPGSMPFDCDRNWALLARCARKALAAAGVSRKSVRAVSSTSMREGVVLYDRSGKEIWACANVDSQAEAEVRELKARLTTFENEFYDVSGQIFALGALPRLLWVRKHRPDIFKRASRVSMLNDWVTARLSGEIVVEPTNGGTSGLLSLRTRDWSDALIEKAGLARDQFPRVVETGKIIGKATATAAEEMGIAPGTPVVAGGGDVQLGSIGLGVVHVGDAAVLGGTFWQQVINIPADRVDPAMRVRINPAAMPGLNQAECISFFVGLSARWFRDALCGEEVREARAKGVNPYDLMEALAAQAPAGAYGVIPIFSDATDFSRWYHAAPSFLNLSLDPAHCSKGVMFRALEENAAIVSAINLERVREFADANATSPLVFAGGASKGKLWPQIVSDVTGREVRIPVVREATSLGGEAAAGVGIGLYRDLAEAAGAMVRWERSVEPNRANRAIYDDAKARWQVAYAAQKILVDKGVTTAMWSAPGALSESRM
jgi:autoinducer 2 (AI-2) kinase